MRVVWIESLWQDVRHASRVFAKNLGFTAIAVVSIAFGTGANVAMFSLADALLLRPLPVARPSELLTVGTQVTRGLAEITVASYPDYLDIRDRSRSFTGLVALTYANVGFAPNPAAPPQVRVATMVSSNFFSVLGVEPVIGREFRPEEDLVPGRDAVTILSYGVWQQEFAGDPAILGRTVRLAGLDFTVVGIAPESFTGLRPYVREAAFVPMAMFPRITRATDDPLTARDLRAITVKGRLREGVTTAEAQAELAAIGKALELAYPDTNTNQAFVAQTELEVRFERSPLDSHMLVVLSILSTAVLCVACANVAGLLASRAPVRAREVAMRMALGAGRVRLLRQLITESLGISLAGGIGGIAVGYVGILLLRQIRFPTDIAAGPQLQLDQRALLFSLAVAVSSAFLFGVGPAIQTTRVNLAGALKTNDVGTTTRVRINGRSVLVSLQVALSLVLLAISAFAYQVFDRALADGPGFRTAQMAKLTITPKQAGYGDTDAVRFFERAADHARRIGSVQHVSLTSAMPLFSFASVFIVPEGYQLPAGQTGVNANVNSVAEDYFATMEIPVLEGRAFLPTDTAKAPRVAIVNEQMARHYWPGADALGKRLRMHDEPDAWIEVVGVAKVASYLYLAEMPQDMLYLPFRQAPREDMVLLAQTSGDSTTLLAPLREMVRTLDADVPVHDVQTIEMFYAARASDIGRVLTRLVAGMGVMGLILTMVGLYGLVSYAVSRRTREIGIRMAIGASARRILLMVLRHGMTPALVGLPIGVALSLMTRRLLTSMIPMNERYASQAILFVVPVVVAIAVLAAFVPARRAARIDPTIALRYD